VKKRVFSTLLLDLIGTTFETFTEAIFDPILLNRILHEENGTIAIPLLKGEKDLPVWRSMVKRAMIIRDPDDYILKEVPELIYPVAKKEWKKIRVVASYILAKSLTKSLTNDHIQQLLIINGWDIDEQDPKKTTAHSVARDNCWVNLTSRRSKRG